MQERECSCVPNLCSHESARNVSVSQFPPQPNFSLAFLASLFTWSPAEFSPCAPWFLGSVHVSVTFAWSRAAFPACFAANSLNVLEPQNVSVPAVSWFSAVFVRHPWLCTPSLRRIVEGFSRVGFRFHAPISVVLISSRIELLLLHVLFSSAFRVVPSSIAGFSHRPGVPDTVCDSIEHLLQQLQRTWPGDFRSSHPC